jgi:HK97 gp10 family phage protein
MPQFSFTIKGIREFEAAIKRNPQRTLNELKNFFVRALAQYRQVITQTPWTLFAKSGGSPVKTGNLRGSHGTIITALQASIAPDRNTSAPYAKYVHDGTRRMKPRPWLDYAFNKKKNDVNKLAAEMLKTITSDLAK